MTHGRIQYQQCSQKRKIRNCRFVSQSNYIQKIKMFLRLVKYLLLFAIFGVNGQFRPNVNECCEDYCYAADNERSQTKKFSTKTAYFLVKGSEQYQQYVVPHCQHKKVWLVSRHGTRLPSAKDIRKLRNLEGLRNEIINNYERGSKPTVGALCREDFQMLKNWAFNQNITENHEEYLTQEGWEDLKFLARNYQAAFPDIFSNTYDSSKFLFRHTNTQRTEASYKAFTEGLFGYNAWNNIRLPPIPVNDTLLRAYNYCPLWDQQKEDRKRPDSEISKYADSERILKLISDVSMRLGFKRPLERNQIELMWDMCRFEQAWAIGRDSPWCTVFTPSQIDIMEYGEDLSYHYKTGHSSELNTRVSCELVQNMLQHLGSTSEPSAIAYFTHSSAVQLFLVALGIAKDSQALRADNYEQMRYRKWRTSQIGPFTANLIAIKYECDNQEQDRTKVIFFLNQKPVQLDWCRVGLCDWHEVKERFAKFFDADCSKMYCDLNSANYIKLSLSIIILAIISLLM